MPSATLFVLVQVALKLTQKQLGQMLGVDRRTIQRWQDRGSGTLSRSDARLLAKALRPTHPDLADEVMDLGRRNPILAPASPEDLAVILEAAAAAAGTTPALARTLLVAAFTKASEIGVDVASFAIAVRDG